MTNTRILQVTPAAGWQAVYASESDGLGRPVGWDLAVWALVEITEDPDLSAEAPLTYVEGMVRGDGPLLDAADSASNFLGYLEPGERDQLEEIYGQAARDYVASHPLRRAGTSGE